MTNGLNSNGSTYRTLRETIKSVLSDLLGTYTYSGSKIQPAIKVDLGVASTSPAPTVKGLEVIIQPSTEILLKPLFGAYEETSTTYIILKQWDISQSILVPLNRLVATLPNITDIMRVPRYTELDNIESCRIQIVDVSMVLATELVA